MMKSEEFNTLELSNTHFAHLLQKRSGSTIPTKRDIDAEKLLTEQASRLQVLLYELPTNIKGLDTHRINTFLKQIDASVKPILFLDSPDFDTALEIVGSKSQEPSGIYFEGLGIALVQRDLGLEAINGTALTESFAVHEAAHSTHVESPLQIVHRKRGIWGTPTIASRPTPRAYGMTLEDSLSPHYGTLFEEGYAELERGLYVQANGLTDQFTRHATNYAEFKKSPIPLHYMYRSAESEGGSSLIFAPGALAATVFEILMRQDDELLPIFRKSRQNNDGLKELAESIDRIVPGLHNELQHAADQLEMASILKEVVKTV